MAARAVEFALLTAARRTSLGDELCYPMYSTICESRASSAFPIWNAVAIPQPLRASKSKASRRVGPVLKSAPAAARSRTGSPLELWSSAPHIKASFGSIASGSRHADSQHRATDTFPNRNKCLARASNEIQERWLHFPGPCDIAVGSGSLDAMLAVCSRVGALGKILREQPELRDSVLPALRSSLSAFDGADGVKLNAATWVVTARA